MEYNHETKTFIAWAAPLSLVLTPLLLGVVAFRIIQDITSGKEVNLLDLNLILIVTFCICGFFIAFFICKKELGWFQGKAKDKNLNE